MKDAGAGTNTGLTVKHLSVDRGGRPVLCDLSFHLAPGAALVVVGPNGSGKSTLLRAVAGLIPRTAGTVELTLESARSAGSAHPEPVDLSEHTHYLGHANGLKLGLTVSENLRFAADWSGTPGLSPRDALTKVGLAHVADFPVGFLSAGQRRRVSLARMLVARQPLWLLDEPAAALDAASEALLARLIRAHLEHGGLALAAIHGSLDVPALTLRLES